MPLPQYVANLPICEGPDNMNKSFNSHQATKEW